VRHEASIAISANDLPTDDTYGHGGGVSKRPNILLSRPTERKGYRES